MKAALPAALLALTGLACTWNDGVAPRTTGELQLERVADVEVCRPPDVLAGELSVSYALEADDDGVATGLSVFAYWLDGSSVGPGFIELFGLGARTANAVSRGVPIEDLPAARHAEES